MRALPSLFLGTLLLGTSASAFAKDDAPVVHDPIPAPRTRVVAQAATAPTPALERAPAAPALPVEATVGAFKCVLVSRESVSDTEARLVARFACEELATQAAAAGTYEISLDRFDGELLFAITGPSGSRRVTLARVNETRTAIPRMVEAMLAKKTVASTENVDNVLTEEGGAPRKSKKKGSIGATVGILGMNAVGQQSGAGTGGALVGIGYETGRLGVFGDLRYAGGSSSSNETTYFALSGGARYYLSAGDIAPFVGGGIALTSLKMSIGKGYYDSYSSSGSYSYSTPSANTGVSAFGEVGIEFLRTHLITLVASARGDAPSFTVTNVERKQVGVSPSNPNGSYQEVKHSSYQVPVTGQLSMFLHW